MPWSRLLCPSARPSSSHPDPQIGVASTGVPPGLKGTGGHSLGTGGPGSREPGGARKDNGGEQECMVFRTRPLTSDSFVPASVINVLLTPSPGLSAWLWSPQKVLLSRGPTTICPPSSTPWACSILGTCTSKCFLFGAPVPLNKCLSAPGPWPL